MAFKKEIFMKFLFLKELNFLTGELEPSPGD
jgi:hypothetical protein